MDWFDYDLYDSDIGDYMDESGFEYGSDHILGESDDSQSTFISFNSGISTVSSSSSSSEDSSQDSDTQNTPQQQASVVIVNSGTGGIVWRNRSDDDEESRMSSSSSSSIRSSGRGGGEQSMMEDSLSPTAVQRRQRYFTRQRRRQGQRISSSQSQEGEGDNNPDIVIESSETDTDNEEEEDNRVLDEDNRVSDEDNREQAQLSREVQVLLSPTLPSAHAVLSPSNPHRRQTQQSTAALVDLTNDDTSNPVIHELGIAAQEVVTDEIINLSNPTNNPLVPERDAPTLREIARAAEKRKASTSPVQKKARLNSSQDSDDDDVDAGCNICYDNYTAVGPHRPACLKCGHIFGFACLERWLKVSCSGGNRRCPSCNKKAHVKDIRLLYCCNLRAVDNTRVYQLSTDLEQEKVQNSKFKVEITSHKIKIEGLEKELTRYKGLEKQGLLQTNKPCDDIVYTKGPVHHLSIALVKNSSATGQAGMARSLMYDEKKNLLLATHQNGNLNGNGMFTGFGYSLVNLLNVSGAHQTINKFFLVSPKAIRDACFHPLDTDLMLIVSLDKTAKLIDVRTGTRVFTFYTESPLWSCAWDPTNPNLFLVGGVNGQLTFFDKRATAWSRPIVTGGTNVGVVSIIGIRAGPGRGLARGGFLVCKLNAVLALEKSENSGQDSIELLDSCGPFMSMYYLESKNQVLLSSRPGPASVHNIRHRVFSLDQRSTGKPVLSLIQTILGGSLAPSLSRSYIWPSEVQGHSLVYAYDAATKSLCGWSVSDATKKVCLPCQDPILDICRVESQTGPMLVALSDAAVHFYKHP
uniref:RING-type E3 ubiquitin transferase n=1 Tax=Cacopsylla melanoneura TaxID=428564 RepID=A0A8D9ENJ2_9HEMI